MKYFIIILILVILILIICLFRCKRSLEGQILLNAYHRKQQHNFETINANLQNKITELLRENDKLKQSFFKKDSPKPEPDDKDSFDPATID